MIRHFSEMNEVYPCHLKREKKVTIKREVARLREIPSFHSI